jgi:hypothetical protein
MDTQRELEDKYRKLSVLVDGYQREIALLKGEMEKMLRDQQQIKSSDQTGRREAGESGNCKQSANECDRRNGRDFGRERNLPPRQQQAPSRTDGGVKEEMMSKVVAMEKLLEEKDRVIRKQNANIQEMKERQKNHIQFIKRQEMDNSSLLHKVRDMREEIISLKKRRPPKEKRAEPSAEQQSLGPGWNHVVRKGRVVKAASPSSHKHATAISTRNEVADTCRNGRTAKSQSKVTVGPEKTPVIEDHQENNRSDHSGRREAGGGRNGQQSGNKRHRPNLPPRLQNRK